MQEQFYLNGRFLINPLLNTLTDTETGRETRLEQRLMAVLTILTNHPNELVTREQLIKEVWDDYGGGDEGLNQAISFIRKALADNKKELIETIPKKGYILHATVGSAEASPVAPIVNVKEKSSQRPYWIAGLLCILLLIAYFSFIRTASPDERKPEGKGTDVIGDSSAKGSPDETAGKRSADSGSGDRVR